jgi:hypothetical protein
MKKQREFTEILAFPRPILVYFYTILLLIFLMINSKVMFFYLRCTECINRKYSWEEYYLVGYKALKSVENQRTFKKNIWTQYSGSKNNPSSKSARLILRPWKWKRYVPPKRKLILTDYMALYPRIRYLHNFRCKNIKSYITENLHLIFLHPLQINFLLSDRLCGLVVRVSGY